MEISKTDFLLYLEAPLHLWAKKHDLMEQVVPSPHTLHLMEQGNQLEDLAVDYLTETVCGEGKDLLLNRRKRFTQGKFQAEVDVLVFDQAENVYDIYEIKSSTGVNKQHKYDVTFQYLVCREFIPIRNFFIVHLNPEFVRRGEIPIDRLFTIDCLDDEILELVDEVANCREAALEVANQPGPEGISECTKPGECPCPQVCHPGLPEYPIYDIPRLRKEKARELKGLNILSITEVPDDYPLSANQRKRVAVAKTGNQIITIDDISAELAKIEFPLYFLDYETYNPGIPWFDGYKPYQHIVFQYSLHVIEDARSDANHFEYLGVGDGDPGIELINHLMSHIGGSGTVIVWNKSFEVGRNNDLARIYPQYAEFLKGINERVFDLMDIFSKGYYLHPGFHGSASIKKVLPVLVEDLDYDSLPISKGDEAMLAWISIKDGSLTMEEIENTKRDLLRYCELDTLAMVKIWKVLASHCGYLG